MTDHPITPPPELVQQWLGTYFGTTVTGEVSDVELVLATQAARWAADTELEACCAIAISDRACGTKGQRRVLVRHIKERRRPKPPSLKEQALEALQSMQIDPVVVNGINVNADVMAKYVIIRRALEQLDG